MIDLCGLVEAKWANACVHEKEIDVSVGDQDVRRRCCFLIIICWFRKIARLTFNNGGLLEEVAMGFTFLFVARWLPYHLPRVLFYGKSEDDNVWSLICVYFRFRIV